ncbi:MAG: family phage major capsid protein [Rickettsiales bacterium]|jgi:HK97 family phage major capsid protein|nr:family phage major capsid protein [Rickettsiales bacterium]
MTINELTDRMNTLHQAWEEFKSINDRRLAEVAKKGSADPLTVDHLGRINDTIDHYKSRLGRLETALSRPVAGMELGLKYMDAAQMEHKQAFCAYLRKGIDDGLVQLEQKALSVGSDPDGGFLVTPTLSDKIVSSVTETSPIRKVASVAIVSTDSLDIIEDISDAGAGWTSETSSVSDSATPQFAKKTIHVHELFAQPKATQKLIDDAAIDIEVWLAERVSEIFSVKENTAFVNGDGVGKPRGFTTYPNGTAWGQIEQVHSGGASTITADSIISLYYSLKEEYAARGSFLMNRSTMQAVRLLKDEHEQYIWHPGLSVGAADTIMGAPVYQSADMDNIGASNLPIAFGDFAAGYQIVDRTGIRVLRDPFTDKPFVKFYTTKRVGGDVINFEAIKLMVVAS